MVIQSIIIGVVFGIIWAFMFEERYKGPAKNSRILARTVVIRYLLLAALLIFLIKKFSLLILWWLVGFLPAFWATLFLLLKKSNPGNR